MPDNKVFAGFGQENIACRFARIGIFNITRYYKDIAPGAVVLEKCYKNAIIVTCSLLLLTELISEEKLESENRLDKASLKSTK